MVDVGPPPQAETGHGLEAVLRRNKEQRVPVLVHLGRFRREGGSGGSFRREVQEGGRFRREGV